MGATHREITMDAIPGTSTALELEEDIVNGKIDSRC